MHGKYISRKSQLKTRAVRTTLATVTRWMTGIALTAVILLNLFTYVIQVVRYNGNGMLPTLESGQTLVLLKTQEVSEGDIIAFYYNNQVLVRRVICEGGKLVAISDDGTVSVNSTPLEEPYLSKKSIGQFNITFPYHVRSGYVFVMGDNRETAMDSRLQEIGPVPEARIIGKVLFVI